jgi:hypothetical protein
VLVDVPSDVLVDVPSDVQHEVPVDVPSDVLVDVPSDVLVDVPSDVQHAALVDVPTPVLIDVSPGPPAKGEAASAVAATAGCPAIRTARMAADTTTSPPIRRVSGIVIAPRTEDRTN